MLLGSTPVQRVKIKLACYVDRKPVLIQTEPCASIKSNKPFKCCYRKWICVVLNVAIICSVTGRFWS